MATDAVSLPAFARLREALSHVPAARMITRADMATSQLVGSASDRSVRNQLTGRWLARAMGDWLEASVTVAETTTPVPQGALVARRAEGHQALLGAFTLTSEGLGIAPGNTLSLIQVGESTGDVEPIASWFDDAWASLGGSPAVESTLFQSLRELAEYCTPEQAYALVLYALLGDGEGALTEDQVVRAATGIRETAVWNKLYKFQRDGVIGAIDKLDRFGGCIIADSVGLGKTFEALAVIKYHELRNDRVLVLCPKRLRDNWTMYTANDVRNPLARDRFNYDVLNHTDLLRDQGLSGDIDLAYVNWGNYDLVVIDESHNFRNKKSPRQEGETRYDRLLKRIVQDGVRTRVLMLSATPVNNRLADLRNQIAFATEGNDAALAGHGIASIDRTTRQAQAQFNKWLKFDSEDRTTPHLVEMLGFGYFALLDHLTIARSRKHIEKYYGTAETGRFPDRLKPINIKSNLDLRGEYPPVGDVNDEIRRLFLASYSPLKYVLPERVQAYEEKYATAMKGGKGVWRQTDREESLIHLMRVNMLKRLESSVAAFSLTIERMLADVEGVLERIDQHDEVIDELDISDVDLEDPNIEALAVGRKVKVLLSDMDLIRWKQDLTEDRNRLASLLADARGIDPDRDAKLAALREMIREKTGSPINAGNRKIIVFTAFADTAAYLYENLAHWAHDELAVSAALVTGSAGIQTTAEGLSRDMTSILTAFAPRAKERPEALDGEGELDLLIATDCISEGQNLQDCDWLINYDIHWNPVRIIQRFGRIDRLGSPNEAIQLVNFWPNMELDEYINLEQRVSGRMVLLDVSATGEENVIEQQSGDPMNDLVYRREQLLRLQDAVVDLEDIAAGVSISDLTLTDFRIDLAEFFSTYPGVLDEMPLGRVAVVSTAASELPEGVTFCLRAETGEASSWGDDYPLAPHFVVHVAASGEVTFPFTQAKRLLDHLKLACAGRSTSDSIAEQAFDAATDGGRLMDIPRRLLAAATASIAGKAEERAVESLFSVDGSRGLDGEFAGIDDFEVVALIAVVDPSAQ